MKWSHELGVRFVELYRRGLTDKEIARELGVSAGTVGNWRRRFGLPPHRARPRRGVRMEEALSPEECTRVRDFLRSLVCYARQLPPGTLPDVSAFMSEWREVHGGRPYHKWTPDMLEAAVRMREKGTAVSEAAVALGVTPNALLTRLARARGYPRGES